MSGLFEPLSLRGVTLRNRIGVSPMCQASARDGLANDWHLVHLGQYAIGGAGLVITEATAVEARGRITDCDLGLWCDEQIGGLSRVANFIRGNGAVPGIQLAHAGRKAGYRAPFDRNGMRSIRPLGAEAGGWQAIGPSALPFEQDGPVPAAMTGQDIEAVCAAFRSAAQRADACGFEWLEVHAAHGYLLHSFCSPLSNRRSDAYGGSLENRIRLTREVARTIRDVWPASKVLSFRLSHTDWIEGGWDTGDSVSLASALRTDGVDIIDVSSGGSTAATVALMGHLSEQSIARAPSGNDAVPVAQIPIGPAYQLPGARAIREGAAIPVAAVGLITEPEQADAILRAQAADLIMLARPMLRDPYWALSAARQLGVQSAAAVPCQYYLAWKDLGPFQFRGSEPTHFSLV